MGDEMTSKIQRIQVLESFNERLETKAVNLENDLKEYHAYKAIIRYDQALQTEPPDNNKAT